MKKFDKFTWTFLIRLTKSEKLLEQSRKYQLVSDAYKKEFERRKKVFNEGNQDG